LFDYLQLAKKARGHAFTLLVIFLSCKAVRHVFLPHEGLMGSGELALIGGSHMYILNYDQAQ